MKLKVIPDSYKNAFYAFLIKMINTINGDYFLMNIIYSLGNHL